MNRTDRVSLYSSVVKQAREKEDIYLRFPLVYFAFRKIFGRLN